MDTVIKAVDKNNMIWLPGGQFLMGSDKFYPEEKPVRKVRVDGFYIDKYEVTNSDYSKFVNETGYTTIAERPLNAESFPGINLELLAPGSMVFQKAQKKIDLKQYSNWWAWIPGASWQHPYGPGSSITGLEKHPVVHVALEDVEAYARWIGKELPTEAEWEYAARGGLEGKDFTWGDEDVQLSKPMANTWQGEFPWQNTLIDKYERTSPVGSFMANGYGLYDMAGNVWEWTADWYLQNPVDKDTEQQKSCCTANINPRVFSAEDSCDPCQPQFKIPRRVLKGGSHLCAPNYCLRYRPAARHAQMIDTGMSHIGFRCILRNID